jgi:hypothetical protein
LIIKHLARNITRNKPSHKASQSEPFRRSQTAAARGPTPSRSRDQEAGSENRSTILTSNRPLEEWGKLLGDVPTAGAILDRFLHHAQTIAITGRSYRLKDQAAIAGKEDKNKKAKSKWNETSTAKPAS